MKIDLVKEVENAKAHNMSFTDWINQLIQQAEHKEEKVYETADGIVVTKLS